MHALVTGGAGFIGSHLADKLLSRGDQVTIIDNLSTGSEENIRHLMGRVALHHGDIRDSELVDKLIKKSDCVFHMAAALGVKNIMEDTIESIDRNFNGSDVVLKSATSHHKRLVIASTSEIYGKNPAQPLNEESDRVVGAPQIIRWSYADAKALEEAVAHTLHKTKGLKVTTVRFFNTVGPRQSGQYGMVLPRFVKNALAGQDLVVYGDGTQSRVFCHVDDAVRAVLMLADSKSAIGDYFNVGGIGEVTISELAQKILVKTQSQSRLTYLPFNEAYPGRFEDIKRRVPDITKIGKQIQWFPSQNLDSIINSVILSLKN